MKENFKAPSKCPHCFSTQFIRKGYYFVRILRSRKRRYYCKDCKRYFSNQTSHSTYYQRRPDLNEKVFLFLVSGNTQQRTAELLNCSATTIARKLVWLSKYKNSDPFLNATHIQIDEMESIEHTKLKPLTIPLCVCDDFRILGLEVGKIPAKGHLAELSRKKYGPRSNERELVFRRLLTNLRDQQKVNPMTITTDSYPLYANLIREYFPAAKHIQIVARDLKEKKRELMHQKAFKKVFDPLFALNQRCAKLRSDVLSIPPNTPVLIAVICGLAADITFRTLNKVK